MAQDVTWKSYFSDDERYAFLRTIRTKTPGQKVKIRDMNRKAVFGVNFAIIGIENQETIDYSMPLRNMVYDVGEYEKQAVAVRREVRRKAKGLIRGEYLYGPKTLHDMLDFTDIPEGLRERMPDYRINLVEIRKLKDTSIFKTDVRQVFDFIRCSEDKKKLKELVNGDEYYKNMEEDAFDVAAHYTNAVELIDCKSFYERKDGKIDMCTAIKELIADGREEGRQEGEKRLLKLLELLKEAGRMEDRERAITDEKYREQLYRENNLNI